MKFSTAVLSTVLATTVSAHGGVLWYQLGSTWFKGFTPYNTPVGQSTIQREWDVYDPIQDPTLTTMRCNTNGAASQLTANVAAGSKVTGYWNVWPHSIGPVLVWMAKCPGACSAFDGSGAVWFKINQGGLESGTLSTGHWAMADLQANNNSWATTIPSTLPAGNYLLRHELLAIHTSNAPQWYPECAQITVTGGGSQAPTSAFLASIPGVYSMSDPNVDIDIYSNANAAVTNYTIPGPAVWTG